MVKGIFRGTCIAYVISEIIESKYGIMYYGPRGDFTDNVADALSWAFRKSIETNSVPLVACLKDMKYRNDAIIPIDFIEMIMIIGEGGIRHLVSFYETNEQFIDPIERRGRDLYYYLLNAYKSHNLSSRRGLASR